MPAARIAATLSAAALAVVTLVVLAADRTSGAGAESPPAIAHPVIVELFTSQGCSSCPPADAFLTTLEKQKNVIPLAFHVDYWDRLGWRDPFSSREATARQMAYVRTMGLNSAYTPQMVVGGTRQFVGSDRHAAREALAAASAAVPAGEVRVTVTRSPNALHVILHAELRGTREHDLMLAVVEDGLSTAVQRGENRGATLANDAVVRKLLRVAALRGGATDKEVDVPIDPAWKQISAVAFLQDAETMAIDGAGVGR
jgi:hypothetical protein